MQKRHLLHAPKEYLEASRSNHLHMTKHPNEALVSSLFRGTVNQINSFLPQGLWSQHFIPAIATRTRMVGESYTNLCVRGQALRMQLEVFLRDVAIADFSLGSRTSPVTGSWLYIVAGMSFPLFSRLYV